MAIVVVNSALEEIAEWLQNHTMISFVTPFQNDWFPGPNDQPSDYLPATWDEMGRKSLTWSVPFINPQGKVQIQASSVTWVSGPGVGQQILYGVVVWDDGANLFYAQRFENPFIVNGQGQVLSYQAVITLMTQGP